MMQTERPSQQPIQRPGKQQQADVGPQSQERFGERNVEECVQFSKERVGYEIDRDTIKSLGCVIHKFLSLEMMFKIKTFGYKYNVTGPNWYSQHLLFEKIYDLVSKLVDEFATENRKFGLMIPTTLDEFVTLSHLEKDVPPGRKTCEPAEMISDLVKGNEEIIRKLDHDIERVAGEFKVKSTEDFLLSVLRKHKKINWMLRATLLGEEIIPK